jgi:hypothetical protein
MALPDRRQDPTADLARRVAIGLFGAYRPLVPALQDLSRLGLPASEQCVLGLHESLHAISAAGDLDESVIAFASHDTADLRAVAPLLGALRAVALLSVAAEHAPPVWMAEIQYRRIQEHLRAGGTVVIASSPTPQLHEACSRSLLRHATHGVQSHDFVLSVANIASRL